MRAKAITRLMVAAALLLGAAPLAAQTGVLSGRVFDAETGAPVDGASVQVLRGTEQVAGGPAGADGGFRFEVAPGTYSIVVSRLGFADRRMDGLSVAAGGTETVSVALASQAVQLNPIVVSASREEEKALEAPADIVTVDAEQIESRPAPTVIEHVKAQPGVDVAQTGIQQAAIVSRGFSNVFSGAMLVITDNRYANVPSLRVNVYSFIPVTNHDMERIELVLGPGAALYGPNAANGVMHILTSSPITNPGTTVSFAGGARSEVSSSDGAGVDANDSGGGIYHLEFHTAQRGSDKWGIRVSGQYFRGEDWHFIDPAEEQAKAQNPANPLIAARDFEAERFNTDVRFDVRPWEDGEIVFAGGLSQAGSQIELTGIGAAQAKDWRYTYGQVRARKGRLFVQGFGNFSDAGDTYLLRTGQPIVDESRLLAAQIQHGTALGRYLDLIYGIDYQHTEPRTNRTITGRNEDEDTINEIGGYLHAKAEVNDQLQLLGAIRVDDHSELEDPVFSPRAAVVFQPVTDQNFRVTFNRAFSTPTTNNLFLDIIAADQPFLAFGIPGFSVRTLGTPPTGLTFTADCPGGVDNFCMYIPSMPGVRLPANAAVAWNSLLNAVGGSNPAIAPLLPVLQSTTPSVGTVLRRFSPEGAATGAPFVVDPNGPQDIPRLQPTITNTFEVGYKGILGGRVLLTADVYRSDIEDFIGPLRVETSSVFLEPNSVAAFLTERLTPLIQAGQLSQAQAAAIIQQLTTGLAQIPIGTIAPDQNPSDEIVLAYRNFGSVDLWGSDIATEILVGQHLTVGGSYSFVSEDCFDFTPSDELECESQQDIAINAPKNKGSLMARWDDQARGWSLGGRARFVSGFPMNSGVYVGDIEGYAVVDANVGYRLPMLPEANVQFQVYNLLNKEHQEFIGAPEIGRMALIRLMYSTK